MLLKKEIVFNLKEKTTQHWVFFCQIACKYLRCFMTDSLNIIFDDFGI